jgi:hypothetical protein
LIAERRAGALPPAPAIRQDDPTVARIRKLIQECASGQPEIWRAIDDLRAKRHEIFAGDVWPAYCFFPFSALQGYMQALLSQAGHAGELPAEMSAHVQLTATIAAWRTTQGIYRYHPETLDALWDTPAGTVPVEALHALPEWCVYIETPDRSFSTGERLHGFFARIDYVNKSAEHLRLTLDITDGPVKELPVSLVPGHTLDQDLADMWQDNTAYFQTRASEYAARASEACRYSVADIGPLVSLVLYLCSQNAEIRARKEGLRPGRPAATKTKEGPRYFPPPQPTAWECGWRIGAAIAAAREQQWPKAGEGTHASPRPHIRRSHWHSFWTGAKAKVGGPPADRKLTLRWLPPIAVNVEDDREVVPAIHEVRTPQKEEIPSP